MKKLKLPTKLCTIQNMLRFNKNIKKPTKEK